MTRIEFDDTLKTGDSRVDEQHRMLVQTFNELQDASLESLGPEVVAPLLHQLHDYTIQHFTAEQELMARSRFPAAEMLEHVEEHRVLTDRVRQLITEYSSGGFESVLPLATLLQDWLAKHIRQSDRRVVEHLRAQGLAEG